MNFRKNSDRPLTLSSPPPPFQKVMLQSIHNSVLKTSCLKVQNLQYNFWIEINPPPPLLPLELFRKSIRFEDADRPLTRKQMYHIEMCFFFIKNVKEGHLVKALIIVIPSNGQ